MKSIFEFGNKNPEFVNELLEYSKHFRVHGLCYWMDAIVSYSKESYKAYEWFEFQAGKEVFAIEQSYPIEVAVHGAGRSIRDYEFFYDEQVWKNLPTSQEGQLRLWWVYNLAVAASHSDVDLDGCLA